MEETVGLDLLRNVAVQHIQNSFRALARVVQLVGHCSMHQSVASLIPGQGICPGCWLHPSKEHAGGK